MSKAIKHHIKKQCRECAKDRVPPKNKSFSEVCPHPTPLLAGVGTWSRTVIDVLSSQASSCMSLCIWTFICCYPHRLWMGLKLNDINSFSPLYKKESENAGVGRMGYVPPELNVSSFKQYYLQSLGKHLLRLLLPCLQRELSQGDCEPEEEMNAACKRKHNRFFSPLPFLPPSLPSTHPYSNWLCIGVEGEWERAFCSAKFPTILISLFFEPFNWQCQMQFVFCGKANALNWLSQYEPWQSSKVLGLKGRLSPWMVFPYAILSFTTQCCVCFAGDKLSVWKS